MLRRRRRISEPTTWGNSSSGYIESKEWNRQTGAVLINKGCV